MTGPKLAAFVQEWVVGRSRRKAGKRQIYGPPPPLAPGEQEIGAETVKSYIAAVVKLWEEQCEDGVNNHNHPWTGAIKKIVDTLNRNKGAQRRQNYVDKGKGQSYYPIVYCRYAM